ncbi:MAG: hypothetical protein KBD46_01680 [Candidatus Levybacteria bacterium]|nr:hypothetical protein [Candidatus Levybacteria bacterium]
MGIDGAKRRQKRFSRKRVLFFFFGLFCFVGVVACLAYTIPELSKYVTHQWYISPLASGFSFNQSGEHTMTEQLVKQKLKKAGFVVESIMSTDDSYKVVLKTGEKVTISQKKPLDIQISSLQLISSRFTIEGKHFVSLDLRFDRPVLVPK